MGRLFKLVFQPQNSQDPFHSIWRHNDLSANFTEKDWEEVLQGIWNARDHTSLDLMEYVYAELKKQGWGLNSISSALAHSSPSVSASSLVP